MLWEGAPVSAATAWAQFMCGGPLESRRLGYGSTWKLLGTHKYRWPVHYHTITALVSDSWTGRPKTYP